MSWIFAFVGFSLLIVLHEFGHFVVAKAVGMRVERFALFFPPLLVKRTWGETEYGIGALPLGGYVKISGMNPEEVLPPEVVPRAYCNQPVWKRIAVIAAGPAVNLVVAYVLLFSFLAFIGPRGAVPVVRTIDSGSPAAAQLLAGDRIISVDGKTGDTSVLARAVASHACPETPTKGCNATEPAAVEIARNGKRMRLEMRPRYDAQLGVMRLGFAFDSERVDYGFSKSSSQAADRMWFITQQTLALPARVFDSEKRKEISSFVGGYEVTRQTFVDSTADAIAILAVISLSLAIINLFPFLPLDGGHIFWAVVEKVRRRPVSIAVMERASVLGIALVIGLFLIGLTNDIDRIAGEGFAPRSR